MIRKITLLTALFIVTPFQLSLADPKIAEEEVTLRFSKQAMPEEIYLIIRKKARRVCESRAIYPHLNLSGEAQCRKQFIQDAVFEIDRPGLTALHHNQTESMALKLSTRDY